MTTRATTLLLATLLTLTLASAVSFAQDAGVVVDADSAPAQAVEATLTQRLETTAPIKTGETVTAVFELTHAPDATVEFPTTYTPDRWVLIDAQKVPTADAERASASTWRVTWGIYRPGTTTLPPFEVRVVDAGNETSLTTQPIEAKVISIFADAKEEPTFKEPRPPVPVWVEDYTLAFVGSGALLFALIGLLAWWVRRRQLMQPPPPPPPRAAHEVALEKLAALAGDDLVERGEYMLFWVRMSEAIREYLGRSYGFPGTELTTTEIVTELHPVKWPSGLGIEDLVSFLRRCDEVKFGGAEPDVDESTSTLRRAFSFVELTRPRPPAERQLESGTHSLSGDTEVDEEISEADDAEPRSKWAPPADQEKPE